MGEWSPFSCPPLSEGDWIYFFALCRRVELGAFFSFFLFIYLAFFFLSFLKLPVGVSGSVPEGEHDHLFALCPRGRVPDREHGRLFALFRRVGLGAFFSVSFFIYLAFFFISFLKLPVGVSGSVPEREHDHLFALCRRVGLGPGLKTCRGGALSRIGNWPLLFAPPCDGV